MDADARTRLGWIRLYEQVGNAGLVCRRCGISRPTLRKWWRRYQAEGEAGLEARSRRPHRSPGRKVLAEQEALILRLRRERKLGIKRLRNELVRRHGLKLSLDTIHKVLVRHGENRLAAAAAEAEGHQALQPTRPGRPRADRHLQDRARALPVHRHRRLLPLAGPGRLPGQKCRQHARLPRARARRDALPGAADADRPRRGVLRLRGPEPRSGTGGSSSARTGPARRT